MPSVTLLFVWHRAVDSTALSCFLCSINKLCCHMLFLSCGSVGFRKSSDGNFEQCF